MGMVVGGNNSPSESGRVVTNLSSWTRSSGTKLRKNSRLPIWISNPQPRLWAVSWFFLPPDSLAWVHGALSFITHTVWRSSDKGHRIEQRWSSCAGSLPAYLIILLGRMDRLLRPRAVWHLVPTIWVIRDSGEGDSMGKKSSRSWQKMTNKSHRRRSAKPPATGAETTLLQGIWRR